MNASTTQVMLGYQVQMDYMLAFLFLVFAIALFWRIFNSQIKSILYPRN